MAQARRTGGGKSIFFAEGTVKAPDGRLIATATGVSNLDANQPVRKAPDIRSIHPVSLANVDAMKEV